MEKETEKAQVGTDKDKKDKGKGTQKPRSRSNSLTGPRSELSQVTRSLQEEDAKMAKTAAAAASKAGAHQRKMTEFMGARTSSSAGQSPSGAGELGAGPCGSEAAPTAEQVSQVLQHLRQQQELAGAAAAAVNVLDKAVLDGQSRPQTSQSAGTAEEEEEDRCAPTSHVHAR